MEDIAGKHVRFDIDLVAKCVYTKEALFQGMGYDGQSKTVLSDIVDSKADTINSDGAFRH